MTVIKVFEMTLVFLSISSESVTVVSFVSTIGTSIVLITMVLHFFTVGNRFVKLHLDIMKNKKAKHKKMLKYLPKIS